MKQLVYTALLRPFCLLCLVAVTPLLGAEHMCLQGLYAPLQHTYEATYSTYSMPSTSPYLQEESIAESGVITFSTYEYVNTLSEIGALVPQKAIGEPIVLFQPPMRRVDPGGGLGEPGALPIGDLPVVAILIAAALYAYCRISRQKM